MPSCGPRSLEVKAVAPWALARLTGTGAGLSGLKPSPSLPSQIRVNPWEGVTTTSAWDAWGMAQRIEAVRTWSGVRWVFMGCGFWCWSARDDQLPTMTTFHRLWPYPVRGRNRKWSCLVWGTEISCKSSAVWLDWSDYVRFSQFWSGGPVGRLVAVG